MRYAVLIIAAVSLAAVASVLTLWDRFLASLAEPAGASAVPVIITVQPGETPGDLLPRLVDQGLVRKAKNVRRYLRDFHDAAALTPGEYALSPAMGPAELIAHLESGRRVRRPVDIPEGSTLETAARLLDEAGIVESKVFLALAERPRVIFGSTQVASAQGFLLPEVYTFPRGTPPAQILDEMVDSFEDAFRQSIGDRTNGLTRLQVVILASIIETAAVPRAERRRYSALLRNRLRAGIPLQSPAARAYAQRYAKRDRSKWDTYADSGLPPGPICSPGSGALLAAADPASSRALYRVARNNGTNVYCDDLDCLYEESRRYKRPLPRPLPLPKGRGYVIPVRPPARAGETPGGRLVTETPDDTGAPARLEAADVEGAAPADPSRERAPRMRDGSGASVLSRESPGAEAATTDDRSDPDPDPDLDPDPDPDGDGDPGPVAPPPEDPGPGADPAEPGNPDGDSDEAPRREDDPPRLPDPSPTERPL